MISIIISDFLYLYRKYLGFIFLAFFLTFISIYVFYSSGSSSILDPVILIGIPEEFYILSAAILLIKVSLVFILSINIYLYEIKNRLCYNFFRMKKEKWILSKNISLFINISIIVLLFNMILLIYSFNIDTFLNIVKYYFIFISLGFMVSTLYLLNGKTIYSAILFICMISLIAISYSSIPWYIYIIIFVLLFIIKCIFERYLFNYKYERIIEKNSLD